MTQGLNNNEAHTSPGDDSQHVVTVDKLEANLFFDGTLNNYFNVVEASEEVRKKFGGEGSSYDNALSNVARMWEPLGKGRDGPDIAVYVDGMGTTRFQADSLAGKAMGQGETGIEQRALQAFGPLIDLLKNKRGKYGPPAILSLNVFGFSRGAATARHFVSLLKRKEITSQFFAKDWRKVILEANFVGLFDTVSSFGYDKNFDDDVQQLHTHFATESAMRVFHIAALDEYRENFSLTNIASACGATVTWAGKSCPMGFEIGIPGAHSDVGGGYHADVGKPETEVRNLWRTSKVSNGEGGQTTVPGPQAFVYQQGWYQPQDVKKTFREPVRHERQIAGDYYKVALSLMVDIAEKYTTADFSKVKKIAPAQEPGIARLQGTLRELSNAHAFKPGKPTRVLWDLNTHMGEAEAKVFRRSFLHVSFNDSIGFGPRYKNESDMERKILQG